MDSPVNYMKYIPLYGQPCKLYEIHTPDMDKLCKLYEIHTRIWTPL